MKILALSGGQFDWDPRKLIQYTKVSGIFVTMVDRMQRPNTIYHSIIYRKKYHFQNQSPPLCGITSMKEAHFYAGACTFSTDTSLY